MTLERFESLLDAYGADFSRWPGAARSSAGVFLKASSDAQVCYSEVVAFDKLLANSSAPDALRVNQLADRIMAAAQSVAPGEVTDAAKARSGGADILTLPRVQSKKAKGTTLGALDRRAAAFVSPSATRSPVSWRAFAALAASLVFGIAIGLSDLAPVTSFNVADLLGASQPETEIVLSGLQLDGLGSLDEDQI